MDDTEIAKAAREYRDAVQALHTTHGSTDVHGDGGFAGQAMTDHCAWTCHAFDARLDTASGKIVGDMNRRLHEDVLSRYEAADAKLAEVLS